MLSGLNTFGLLGTTSLSALSSLPQVLSSTPFDIWLEGDSNTAAHSPNNATTLSALGQWNWVAALTYGAIRTNPQRNFGIGGGTLATMNAEKTTQLVNMTGEFLAFNGGTNDVGVAAPVLATMQMNFTQIKDYVLNTLSRKMVVTTIPPRSNDDGTDLNAVQLAALKGFNSWLMAQHDPANGFIAINTYDALCTAGTDLPNPDYFYPETNGVDMTPPKLLHKNPSGAIEEAFIIKREIAKYGVKTLSLPATNFHDFPNLTGTGGEVGSNASGQVPDGWKGEGFGGTSTRLFTVDAQGCTVDYSTATGDPSFSNVKLRLKNYKSIAGGDYAVGDSVYGWAEIEILNATAMDGPWLTVEDRGASTIVYNGLNKAGSSSGFVPVVGQRFLMMTEIFTIAAGNTHLNQIIQCQVDGSVEAARANFRVSKAGFTVV